MLRKDQAFTHSSSEWCESHRWWLFVYNPTWDTNDAETIDVTSPNVTLSIVHCCEWNIQNYHLWIRIHEILDTCQCRIQDFPEGVPTYYLAIFSRKPHGNEEILGQRGPRVPRLLDPPMYVVRTWSVVDLRLRAGRIHVLTHFLIRCSADLLMSEMELRTSYPLKACNFVVSCYKKFLSRKNIFFLLWLAKRGKYSGGRDLDIHTCLKWYF